MSGGFMSRRFIAEASGNSWMWEMTDHSLIWRNIGQYTVHILRPMPFRSMEMPRRNQQVRERNFLKKMFGFKSENVKIYQTIINFLNSAFNSTVIITHILQRKKNWIEKKNYICRKLWIKKNEKYCKEHA